MQMVILAGGQRSTISTEPEGIAKPMLQIGGRPLIWHVMKHASNCGVENFVICAGYKIETIKEYFLDFYIYQSDVMVDTGTNTVEILNKNSENWKVTIVDTGIETLPISRIKQVTSLLEDSFWVTYSDCLSDIPLQKLREIHEKEKHDLTVALARPSGRNNPLRFYDGIKENITDGAWTSAGTFMMNKQIFNERVRDGDIEELTIDIQASYFKHDGFYSAIETRRDKVAAEEMWISNNAPWVKSI